MLRAVIFDLDDTLYDERQFVRGGLKSVAKYISRMYKVCEKKTYNMLLGLLRKHGRGRIFDLVLELLGVAYTRKTIARLVSVYRYHHPKLSLYPEVRLILRHLKKSGYHLGLITDGNARVQRRKVKSLGVASFFDCMIFSREYGVNYEKPNISVYKRCLSRLNVCPEESVYVGDNSYKDFVNAKKLGIYTVRVMKGQYRNVIVPETHEAHFRIVSLRKLLPAMNVFNKIRSGG